MDQFREFETQYIHTLPFPIILFLLYYLSISAQFFRHFFIVLAILDIPISAKKVAIRINCAMNQKYHFFTACCSVIVVLPYLFLNTESVFCACIILFVRIACIDCRYRLLYIITYRVAGHIPWWHQLEGNLLLIIIIVAVVLILVLILICVAIYIVCRRKRSQMKCKLS